MDGADLPGIFHHVERGWLSERLQRMYHVCVYRGRAPVFNNQVVAKRSVTKILHYMELTELDENQTLRATNRIATLELSAAFKSGREQTSGGHARGKKASDADREIFHLKSTLVTRP